jgi:NADPH-dependent glutamate synthase beta subunit-like oxidoreductase
MAGLPDRIHRLNLVLVPQATGDASTEKRAPVMATGPAVSVGIVRPMAVALITGGSRGIGAATAVRLAEDGHDVVIGYRSNAEAAEQVAAEIRAFGRTASSMWLVHVTYIAA